MKKNMCFIVGCAMAVLLLFGACGQNGTPELKLESKEYPKNEIFGNLFGIKYQQYRNDSIIKAWYSDRIDELEAEMIGKEVEQTRQQYDNLKKKRDEDLNKQYEKSAALFKIENELILGKKIPFEMEEGLGYAVAYLRVNDISDEGYVNLYCAISVLDSTLTENNRYPILNCELLDSKGNVIKNLSFDNIVSVDIYYMHYLNPMGVNNKDAYKYFDFAKVRFINK